MARKITQEDVTKVNMLRESMTVKDACGKVGIKPASYFSFLSRGKGKTTRRRRSTPTVLDIPMNAPSEKAFAIYGSTSMISEMLRQL